MTVHRFLSSHWAWPAGLLGSLAPIEEPVAALRLVYYLGGLACFSTMWFLHDLNIWLPRLANGLAVFTSLSAGLGFFFLACRTTVPRGLSWLLPYGRVLGVVGLVGTLWASSYSLDHIAHFPTELGRPRHYWNDAIAMTDCSTRLVLQGQNPYTDFSLADCFARLHMTGKFSTPLRAGVFAHVRIYPTDQAQIRLLEMAGRHHVQHPVEFESYLSYPAGAFLVPAPFYALGWHEMSTFYIAWIVLAYLLLAWWAPRRLRPWLVPLALANLAYWDYAIHGFSEGLVVFLILAGWVTRRRTWLSAVLMGVAIATRQDAWLFALFYAILIGRTCGWRDAARRLAMMVALFGLANGPFVLWSPTAWIAGIFGPLRDPMFPRGEGFIALGTTGWLPLWPRPVYTALEIAVLGACLLLYGGVCRYEGVCRTHPDTGLVLALVPLVFAWRALFVYFLIPLPILCLAPLLMDLRAHPSHRPASGMPSSLFGVRTAAAPNAQRPTPNAKRRRRAGVLPPPSPAAGGSQRELHPFAAGGSQRELHPFAAGGSQSFLPAARGVPAASRRGWASGSEFAAVQV